jgi:hypothetical protein
MSEKLFSADGEYFYSWEELIDKLVEIYRVKNIYGLKGMEYYEGEKIPIPERMLVKLSMDSFYETLNEEAVEQGGGLLIL